MQVHLYLLLALQLSRDICTIYFRGEKQNECELVCMNGYDRKREREKPECYSVTASAKRNKCEVVLFPIKSRKVHRSRERYLFVK